MEKLINQILIDYNVNSYRFMSITEYINIRIEIASSKKQYKLASQLIDVYNFYNNDFY